MLPSQVILPRQTTHETRAVLGVCVSRDIQVTRANLEELPVHAPSLRAGSALPVGSVEYLRQAMDVAGLTEPENLSYHPSVRPFLRRPIHNWLAGELRAIPIPRPIFVKPAQTKLFTGFVLVPGQAAESYSLADQEAFHAYLSAPDEQVLWTSPNMPFVSEWRYYVMDGAVLGASRYDPDGSDNAPEPDPTVVQQAVQAAWTALNHPFALDMGVHAATGKTAVVELNDAWAIGLWGADARAPRPADYTSFLWARWLHMHTLQTDQRRAEAGSIVCDLLTAPLARSRQMGW
ncbi:ATP-grasp domain-containing protein, partial [Polaromonas sp.]|uniref:ATP-grasp domain-containing protein n=1 Tax=Polaromonas sp. TaxID=1869339 RepID=UPI00352AFC65